MTGQLNEHPLAELIREISASNLSGALRLSRESAKVVIYFDAGKIIYAASNLRTYRLLECVRRWGVLTEEQLTRVQAKPSDLEFGAALVEAQVLSRDALDELVSRQVSDVLCLALLWPDGQWDYDPRVRLATEVRAKVKTEELLMESARRLPPGLVESRLEGRDGKLSAVAGTDNSLPLLPTEAFVLTRVDSSLSMSELLAIGGLPESDILRLVYTLALGGLLNYDNWPKALSEEALAKGRAAASSHPTPGLSPMSPKEIAAAQAKAAHREEPRDEKSELEALFARLDVATNYYQLLGVVRPAKDADIKRAYHSLAKRFHPDRFRRTVDDTTHARIESAFARIAQAYDALKDKNLRATYDTKLLRQEEAMRSARPSMPTKSFSTDPASSPAGGNPVRMNPTPIESNKGPASFQAEEKFQQGLSALRGGNHTLAIGCLGEAARLMPAQPRYRAYFGKALAKDERMRRNAEAELRAAISLDANNASYRVMLAEFYIEIGHQRRAQGELERALAVEPGNEAARRLLDKMKQ